MTEPTQDRKDDEDWLAVLAGREAALDDEVLAAQASMLRTALQARRARVEEDLPVADPALFSRILDAVHDDRAEREAGSPTKRAHAPLLAEVTGGRGLRRPWAWGVAASVTLATVLSWTVLVDKSVYESQVLRGRNDTILIDPDPSARLSQLRTLLENAGSRPDVRPEKNGTVVITVAETPQVLDALGTERIFPQPVGGKIVIVIEKPAPMNP